MTRDQQLIDKLSTELMLLRAAWLLVEDDNRRRKQLTIGPSVVRYWSTLITAAGKR